MKPTHSISAAILFLCAVMPFGCGVDTQPVSEPSLTARDLSTPQLADQALRAAIRTGDVAGIRAVTVYEPYWEKVIDGLGAYGKQKVRLTKAITDRWGADAPNYFIGLHDVPTPSGYVLKINGDTAQMVDEKYPDAPTPARYRKVNGNWKVDWKTGNTPQKADQLAGWHLKDAKTAGDFVQRVNAGEFKDAAQAGQAYRAALDVKFEKS